MTEEVPSEENVISPEEFFDLESSEKKKEEKKGKRFGIFGGGKKEGGENALPSQGSTDTGQYVTDLSMRLERLGGRLEILEDGRKNIDERLGEFAEKIGELRSSIVERDRTFNEISAKFEKISDIAADIEPQKISRDLNKKAQEIEQIRAQAESNGEKISILMRKMSGMSEALEQIRGMKDLVSVAEELNKKVKMVDEIKRETERTAGRFETRLYEVNEAISKTRSSLDKIDANDEAVRELMRTLDGVSMKVETLAKKDDLNSQKDTFENQISELRFDMESKIGQLLESVKKRDGGFQGSGSANFSKRLDELSKKTDELAGELANCRKEMHAAMKLLGKGKSAQAHAGKTASGADSEYGPESASDVSEDPVFEKINALREQDLDEISRRFSDLEIKILELSKNIDHRIEHRVTKESREAREAIKNIAGQIAPTERFISAKGRGRVGENGGKSQVSVSGINQLIKDVQYYIDSNNEPAAKSGFIKLLALYERMDKSNPFLLSKITELHGKICSMN
ncbi:MAG: hypothetical protein ACP5E4_01205 [Candidatus Aenigmatarchaeota archaeon]